MSLITNKFDYQLIPRSQVDGKRLYNTPDGNAVASVTTILGATSDKSHLVEWRKRVGEKRAQEITYEASSVGTRMHSYLEKYVETGVWPSPGSNPFSKKAHCMAAQIRDNALVDLDEIWGSEVSLYMPHLYAGTADLIGVYKGNPSVLDFKQSNRPKKEEWVTDYYLQLVFYIMAHNEVYGTNICEGHIFMCTRGDDPLKLGGETYQQFDVWPDQFDYWKNQVWDRVYSYYESLAN